MKLPSLRRIFLFLLSVLAVDVVCGSQIIAQDSTLAESNSYAYQANQIVQPGNTRLFASVVSDTADEREDWREFKDLKALENSEVTYFEHASISLQGKNPIAAYFELTSPSGDWAHKVFYYFRKDGTLAKIHSVLNTFHGNVIVIKDKACDKRGTPGRTITRILDINSGQPKKTRNFMDQEILWYRRTQDLPFYRLL